MALFRCNSCNSVYEDYYPPDDTCLKCRKGLIRIITYQGGDTMTAITPTIKLFTSQDHDNQGIQINRLILEHNGNHYQFHGGSNDTVHVFTESIALYVLSINQGNGTMALNAFMSPEPDPINGIYLHTPGQIRERLGDNWEQLPALYITLKLISYLM